MKMIVAHDAYNHLGDLAIIVDSDLGNIPDYNARKKPIIGSFYVPDKMTLVYASSDTGKEYLANRLIAVCDTEANKLIQHIQRSPDDKSNLLTAQDLPFSHIRLWNCS